MNAAFDLIPLLLLAVLPMTFVVQFFGEHSRKAAWATPARTAPAPAGLTSARPNHGVVVDLDEARAARSNNPVAA